MKAVADTNVIAYFLLGTEQYSGECRTFLAAFNEVLAPELWEAELANVLWMATRKKLVTMEEVAARLVLAGRLGIHTTPNRALWQGALLRAGESGIAVYDALFVELAAREQLPLATFDAVLLRRFPDIAARPDAMLKS